MPFLELFDETLDINSTENYESAVQIGSDSLSFCLLDTIRNKYVLLRQFSSEDNKAYNTDQINDIIKADDFLTRKYKRMSIITPSQKFTLIPAPLFDPAKKEEYFFLNHLQDDGGIILTNKIPDPDSYLVYAASKPVNESVSVMFPGALPMCHMKPLLSHISHARKSVTGNYIHVHVERDFFNLVVFSGNTLKFCNTFTYRNITDIMYFVMNVFRNLELKQEETINFSGMTEKYDDLTSAFSIYVRNIKFALPAGNFTFSYVFNEAMLHKFLNLFTLLSCA
jgi:hypothetical protein